MNLLKGKWPKIVQLCTNEEHMEARIMTGF